jgi:hypothetical protein
MSALTASQRCTLFAAIRDAARGLGETPEVYRKRVMREELGVEHLAEVSRTDGYDRLMSRICRDAGDDARAIRFAVAPAARYRRAILEAAGRIAPGRAVEYVAGVMVQARMVHADPAELAVSLTTDSGWAHFSVGQLKKVLAMLRIHVKRAG